MKKLLIGMNNTWYGALITPVLLACLLYYNYYSSSATPSFSVLHLSGFIAIGVAYGLLKYRFLQSRLKKYNGQKPH